MTTSNDSLITDPSEVPEDHPLHDRLNLHRFIFCAGCLIGTTIQAITSCLVERGLTPKDYAIVSGIGCTGRTSGCFKAPAFHATHGRAIPFASGLKLANPDLEVFVLSGDGDLFAIGGNHFIHACRRNIEINVICNNNGIYGMTGGQLAPTTSIGHFTTTSPFGNVEPPFNLVTLAAASGASYVARWPGYDVLRLKNSILAAMDNPGFSFIEVLAPCFTQLGRKNKLGDAVEMVEWLRRQVVIKTDCPPHEAVHSLEQQKIICGEFVNSPREGFTQKLQYLREVAQKKR